MLRKKLCLDESRCNGDGLKFAVCQPLASCGQAISLYIVTIGADGKIQKAEARRAIPVISWAAKSAGAPRRFSVIAKKRERPRTVRPGRTGIRIRDSLWKEGSASRYTGCFESRSGTRL